MKKKYFLIIFLGVFGFVYLLKWNYKPKVYDCFLFNDEFSVLDIRLNEMKDKVEKFVLIEATRNFRNQPKPLYFSENKEKYIEYQDKIVHVIVDKFPEFGPVGSEDYWEMENFQRDRLKVGLNKCRPHKRDIVIFTDCDEIIKKEKVDEIVDLIDKENSDVVFGSFINCCYFLNRVENIPPLCIPTATSYGLFSKHIRGGQAFRDLGGFTKGHPDCGFRTLDKIKQRFPGKKLCFARTLDTGWHFSSLGGYQKALEKLSSNSHISSDTEENHNFNLHKKLVSSMKFCEIDDTYPQYVVEHEQELVEARLIDKEETIFSFTGNDTR